jgi:hypothetical protein
MENLRLISLTTIDNTHIACKFTHPLNPAINTGNIAIEAQSPGIDNPAVLEVDIVGDTLTLTTQPLIQEAAYIATFSSDGSILFTSLNATAIIINDSVSNKRFFTGPIEALNPIKNSITNLYKNNVYNFEDGSNVSKYIDAISTTFSKALYNLGQTKNDNYLSFDVKDEVKTRGAGAYDRLNEEGAYELVRVGLAPTAENKAGSLISTSFPSFPASLISVNNVESFTTTNVDTAATLNLKTLVLNCSKLPVIKINSITFIYNSIFAPYSYNIETLGYQVKDSKYDPDFAFTYLSLKDNQFKLNDKALQDPLFSLENIASITIGYQFKDTGIIIDPVSVSAVSVISSGREVLPPLSNIFNLKFAPIVSLSNVIGTLGSVAFTDPNAIPGSNSKHPAFLYEVMFRLEQLPSRPGEYSIDYATGMVYVFGEDINKAGTGNFPPIAIYSYRHTYEENIDFVYDSTFSDIVALPDGSMVLASTIINYKYEKTLVNGIDYTASLHKEALSERVDNRLVALNAIRPNNFPITNVFRIFNETTGEIYKASRWTSDKIFFTYNTAPNIKQTKFERANFEIISNETLFINSSSALSSLKQIYKITLLNNNIISNSEDSIGNPQNTSIQFSDTTIFSSELYYDPTISQTTNLSRLTNLGQYEIDYSNGVIWVVVSTAQDFSVGTITYKRGYIKSQNPHIISIEDIYFKINSNGEKSKSINYNNFTDNLILPKSFDLSAEETLAGTSLPYQVNSNIIGTFDGATFTPGVSDYVKYTRGVYDREDFLSNPNPINFSTVATSSGKTISLAPLTYQEYHLVEQDGGGYFITTNRSLNYLSSGITFTVSVKRLSDSASLWNGSGTIAIGSPFKLRLPGINSTATGDSVLITYTFQINNLSRIVADYSRGDLLVNYNYLFDEIILSYEYGDNVINFASSNSVPTGTQYYVSYRTGALRDALLKNFGTLIDIPILNNLNVDFERERYRDALMAAMQSFTQGPTVASLRNIVSHIVHSPPEIIESTFQSWDLSTSILSPEDIKITGTPGLLPGRHGNGVFIKDPGTSLSFPVMSNLKLEEGSLEMWVVPQWNGIDNQAGLSFQIKKDGNAVEDTDVFLGPAEDHPTSLDGLFTVSDVGHNLLGLPSKNKDGIYIYLSQDVSGKFNRWNVDILDIVDGYADGYSDGYSDGYVASSYDITIETAGTFYDVKTTSASISTNGKIISGKNQIKYLIIPSASTQEGITFTSDYEHYLFDFGELIPQLKNSALTQSDVLYLNGQSLITDSEENFLLEDGDILYI